MRFIYWILLIIFITTFDYMYFFYLIQTDEINNNSKPNFRSNFSKPIEIKTKVLLCTVITTFICPSSETEIKHLIQLAFLTNFIQIKPDNVEIVLYGECELYSNFTRDHNVHILPFPKYYIIYY